VCRSGSDLARATMAIQPTTDMGIIRMGTIDHTRTIIATTGVRHSIGPAAIESTTATIVTITTGGIGTKLT